MRKACGLVLRELAYRKWNFALGVLAALTAVALFVAFYTTAEAQKRETSRVTRDLGHNLRIIPRDTDMNRFYRDGFSDRTFSEDAVHRVASRKNISYNHLVAVLQKTIELGDKEVILTGLSPEYFPPGRKKPSMSFRIEPGTVHLGYIVAQQLGVRAGDSIDLLGQSFRVEKTLSVMDGTDDDIRIFGLLSDIQSLVALPGRINEIKAIDCLCLTPEENPLEILKAELENALPEARVVMLRSLAETRARQRRMTERYFAFILPLVLVVCGVWIAALGALNVRERHGEIGILRALGHGAGLILSLFLGKAVLVGLLGAIAGYALGSLLAFTAGPAIFPVTAGSISWSLPLLGWALVGAPLFAAVSTFVPAMAAVTRDPAVTLR